MTALYGSFEQSLQEMNPFDVANGVSSAGINFYQHWLGTQFSAELVLVAMTTST